ncbi:MAG: dTDP-4-dehydrorhamnose 3,5-epimerase [Bacteroidota bacterium]
MGFHKRDTSLQDVVIIEPDVFGDDRGFFKELHNSSAFAEIGLGHLHFVQDNLSQSARGTIRGLHFQRPPYAQGKLITVLQGEVLDVVVDVRKSSPTFGQSLAVELSAKTHRMLYVPEGFAHGFQVLSESCLFFYKCTNFYNRKADGGIFWNDPALNIPWRDIEPVLSEKDLNHPVLADFDTPFQYVADRARI